jgi:hypothetical protein
MNIEIDLQGYQDQVKLKKEQEQTFIFDPIRKSWLVLLPEELVRQLVLQFLIHELGYKKGYFKVEEGLYVNDRQRRTDILAYDKDLNPFLLVECKAPQIPLNEKTFWQTVHYNRAIQAPYIMITNGIRTFCCQMDYEVESGTFVDVVPNSPL